MEEKLTARRKKALETREKLIKAAKKVFDENGFAFDQVPVELITKEAGVATGTFYTYFKRKEDIIGALNDSYMVKLDEVTNSIQDKDILDRFKFYCAEYLRQIESHGLEICRQWIRNNISPMKIQIFGKETTIFEHDIAAVKAVIKEGIRRGELVPDIPMNDLALFIVAELLGLQTSWCMSDAKTSGSEMTDRFCDTVLSAVLEKYRTGR